MQTRLADAHQKISVTVTQRTLSVPGFKQNIQGKV